MQNINLTSLPLEETNFVVLDFETTGLKPQRDRVIEVGLVKVEGMKITETFSSLVNPLQPLPFQISNLTGITNEELESAPTFDEIAREILDFIGDGVLVAHNSSFDCGFLKEELLRAGYEAIPNPELCTLKLARKILPHLRSKSLGSVANNLRILHKNVHRALGDATVTAKILIRFLHLLKEENDVTTLADLLAFQGYPEAKRFVIIKKKLADDLVSLPNEPGVYFFHDSRGNVIYIGKAKSLKNRVKNYFYFNAAKKSKEIVRRASRISFEKTNSELSALIAETELIKRYNPKFNVLQKRYPASYFVEIKLDTPAPYLKVTTTFKFDGNDYFGPYQNRETANLLLEITNKFAAIRECTEKEFKQGRKCYLYDIGRCLAPCEYSDIEKEYAAELEKAYDFLSGNNQTALNSLLTKMKNFSEARKYEEAAEIRDTVNLLLNQVHRNSLIQGQINKATVLIKIKDAGKTDYLALIKGKLAIKDFFLDSPNAFENALEGFYSGEMKLFEELTEQDLERLKIALRWLSQNHLKAKVFNLKDYNSKEELLSKISSITWQQT